MESKQLSSEYEEEKTLRADFWAFAGRFSSHTYSLTGAILSTALMAVLQFLRIEISLWWIVPFLVFAFFSGSFLSWRDERRAKEKAQRGGLEQKKDLESKLQVEQQSLRDFKILYESKIAPKLSLALGRDVPGCYVPNTTPTGNIFMFRLAVASLSIEPIRNCQGRLCSIRRGTEVLWEGHNEPLTFERAEDPDTTSKTIHPATTAYLDILYYRYSSNSAYSSLSAGTVDRRWGHYPNINSIFQQLGEYFLEIQIVADNSYSISAPIKFNHTQNTHSASMEITSEPR